MAETTLYLFDGYNLLHAGGYKSPSDLVDMLASFVAGQGARGVVVFDGSGADRAVGPLVVRWAAHADDLLERLAAEHRGQGAGVHRLLGRRRPPRLGPGSPEAHLAALPRRARPDGPSRHRGRAAGRRRARPRPSRRRDPRAPGATQARRVTQKRPGRRAIDDRGAFVCRATRLPTAGPARPTARARAGGATRASGAGTSSTGPAASSSRGGGRP